MSDIAFSIINLLILSALPAGFSYFLDYLLGFPGEEKVSRTAIFFKWTFYLAEKRFKKSPQYSAMYKNLISQDHNDPLVKQEMRSTFEDEVVRNGKEMFSYEWALGMCIYCTNVYIAFLAGLYFSRYLHIFGHWFFTPVLTIIFSHAIIRKLKS